MKRMRGYILTEQAKEATQKIWRSKYIYASMMPPRSPVTHTLHMNESYK